MRGSVAITVFIVLLFSGIQASSQGSIILIARDVGNNYAVLEWTSTLDPADFEMYVLFWSTDGGLSFSPKEYFTDPDMLRYRADNLLSGTRYQFYVRWEGTEGTPSIQSNVVDTTTTVGRPNAGIEPLMWAAAAGIGMALIFLILPVFREDEFGPGLSLPWKRRKA